MAWQIRLTPDAEKELSKLSPENAGRITRFLWDRVVPNPRLLGGPLKGQLRDFWRYRIGDYRVLARIEDEHLLVLVVHIAHRSRIY
ncbi:MAG: type II toxin-antitoxin system RelE/ParE family toxin [Deltaproteobacteria bacterium]|nr:type II toxin-antitoxin system RelE/ParE family toxin [Deltaproteobacteria bacterium]